MNLEYIPQFFPKFWENEYDLKGVYFTDEISIGFVKSEDGHYSYLLNEEFTNLNCSLEELYKLSIQNLENNFEDCDLKHYKLQDGNLVFWSSDEDNFTAVRILSTKYLNILSNIFNGDFKFTIPERDTITCWQSSDESINNKFTQEASEDFDNSEYNLSKKVYQFSKIIFPFF